MQQQYMTAGILCAGVGVSRSRGREGSKNTCVCCHKRLAMLRSASPIVAESFVTIKACKLTAKQNKQSRYNLSEATAASRGLIQGNLISLLFDVTIILISVLESCSIISFEREEEQC